jgi:hypothetical protein
MTVSLSTVHRDTLGPSKGNEVASACSRGITPVPDGQPEVAIMLSQPYAAKMVRIEHA